MKVTLKHYQDTSTTELIITFTGIILSPGKFMTFNYNYGVYVRCLWGALIRLHLVSNCGQRLSWPDK